MLLVAVSLDLHRCSPFLGTCNPVVSTSREASSRGSRVPLSRVNFSGFVGRTAAILEGQIGMVYMDFYFGFTSPINFLGCSILFNMNYNPLPIVMSQHFFIAVEGTVCLDAFGCPWVGDILITPRAGFTPPNMVLSAMLCAFVHFQPQARVVPSHHVDRMIYIYILRTYKYTYTHTCASTCIFTLISTCIRSIA